LEAVASLLEEEGRLKAESSDLSRSKVLLSTTPAAVVVVI
jgi:hypothetical protein